jgi:hypothetical protein
MGHRAAVGHTVVDTVFVVVDKCSVQDPAIPLHLLQGHRMVGVGVGVAAPSSWQVSVAVVARAAVDLLRTIQMLVSTTRCTARVEHLAMAVRTRLMVVDVADT